MPKSDPGTVFGLVGRGERCFGAMVGMTARDIRAWALAQRLLHLLARGDMEVVMTEDDIQHVQHSWRQVLPMKETVAALFYRKLLQLDPELHALLSHDTDPLGAKLIQMISASVRALGRLDVLLPVVRELGTRQLSGGFRDEHYGSIGSALLWTLEQLLRQDFSPEVKSAWIKAYGVLSQTLREAALAHEAA